MHKTWRVIKRRADRVMPGYLEVLEIYTVRNHGKPPLHLLFDHPSKLYEALLSLTGDISVADYVIKNLILKPLSEVAGGYLDEDHMLKLIKSGRDDAVRTALTSFFPQSS